MLLLAIKREHISLCISGCTRPNKNKCVSGNRSENLGRVGAHIFFSGKKFNFVH